MRENWRRVQSIPSSSEYHQWFSNRICTSSNHRSDIVYHLLRAYCKISDSDKRLERHHDMSDMIQKCQYSSSASVNSPFIPCAWPKSRHSCRSTTQPLPLTRPGNQVCCVNHMPQSLAHVRSNRLVFRVEIEKLIHQTRPWGTWSRNSGRIQKYYTAVARLLTSTRVGCFVAQHRRTSGR